MGIYVSVIVFALWHYTCKRPMKTSYNLAESVYIETPCIIAVIISWSVNTTQTSFAMCKLTCNSICCNKIFDPLVSLKTEENTNKIGQF